MLNSVSASSENTPALNMLRVGGWPFNRPQRSYGARYAYEHVEISSIEQRLLSLLPETVRVYVGKIWQVFGSVRFRPLHPRRRHAQGVGSPFSGWEWVGGGRLGGAAWRGQEHALHG